MRQENPFGPKQISFQEILLDTAGSFIAGIIGSVIILMIIILFSNFINISENILKHDIGEQTNNMFPLLLSIIALIGTSVTMFLSYFFLTLTSNDRYKKNSVVYGQIAFFLLICYIFATPLYILAGQQSYENILFIFLGHTLLVSFGTNIIIELLNNYRYILTGIYGSFIGLFIAILTTIMIFFSFGDGYAKLLSLLFLMPFINLNITFLKEIFLLIYYQYNKYTNLDGLGDIFYQIEMEEKELVKEALEKDTI